MLLFLLLIQQLLIHLSLAEAHLIRMGIKHEHRFLDLSPCGTVSISTVTWSSVPGRLKRFGCVSHSHPQRLALQTWRAVR